MIARLRGELLEVADGSVVVEAGGVGYQVLVPESVLAGLPPVGEAVDLHIRQVFREDGVSLYGFSAPFQRRLFDLLLEVKGCGPKIGLALLGLLGEDAVVGAIQAQDVRALCRAPGVGAKLAERIVLELRDKVQHEALVRRSEAVARRGAARADDDLVLALLELGYRRAEAEDAAAHARSQSDVLEEQLKIAVRSLSR
ncbi:MAG: Holliday junction branch migration protein RuvA [Fimbriimonadales bacterium]|nr:Holliday junction branch migration protein RuvA [Fimbriimonadales bacterium]